MPAAEAGGGALTDDEIADLLDPLANRRGLVLAVSGGPDSLGMLAAFARWGANRSDLHVASVDHGLRPEAAAECQAVMAAAAQFGLPAKTLHWTGPKPAAGLQEAARAARYALLLDHARAVGAEGLVLAHHLDDQAETVLMRLARGSGPLGLKAMAPVSERDGLAVLRPFLWLPRARLAAMAAAAGLAAVNDPSNADDRFTRVRLRALMPQLAAEGLTAERLAIFAGRMRMLDEALGDQAAQLAGASAKPAIGAGTEVFDGKTWPAQPFVAVMRLLGDAVAKAGDPDQDARLEALEALTGEVLMALAGGTPHRETLRGASIQVTASGHVVVAAAPPRKGRPG